MIKKILDWILGKNDSASSSHPLDGATRAAQERAQAPYKVETPPAEKSTDTAPAWHTAPAEGSKLAKNSADVNGDGKINLEDLKAVVETKPVTVKAKYKKAELNKKTKKELLDLAAQNGVEVKSRATKEELVKVLSKV